MENKNYITVFITTFYVLGLCTFYTEKRLFFAVAVCLLLVSLCCFNKLKPVLCLVLCFIFFGGFLNADFQNKKFDTFSSIQSADNTILKGRVYSIPAINKEKNIAKFYMGVYEANIQSENFKPENTKVLVSIFDTKESYNNIKIGDVIKIKGNLRTPREATNPSEFDYKKYLQNKDVFTILYSSGSSKKNEGKFFDKTVCESDFKIISSPNIKQAQNKIKEIWWVAIQGLDTTRNKIILKHSKHIKSPNLEVFGGVVFGDDAINPPDDVKQSFINSGLLHLLAASGLNVALIFGIWWGLASFLNLPYRTNILTGMVIIVLYTFMTGFPPSILRAGIMLLLILIGKLMFKTADSIALIFFTGFIMLLFNPKLLNDVGFQLSFLVTGGLITCIEPVCAKFKALDKSYKSKFFKKPALIRAAAFLFSPISLLGVVLVPLTAQIWAAPLQGYYFNTFTPYSVFANIAVVPFIGIISFIGFLSSILSLVPFLGDFTVQFASFILNPLIALLLTVSNFFSKLPASIIKIPSGSAFYIIVYYSFVLTFVFCLKNNFKKLKTNAALGILACILLFGLIKIPNGNFEILTFDVGNADSLLIRTPKNKYIMIDTGRLPYRGISSAKRIINEYFYDRNIRALEYLILTHFDNDHSGGTIDVLNNIKVKNVIIQKKECDTKNSCEILKYLKENNLKTEIATNKTIYREKDFEIKTFAPKISRTETLNKDKFENETSTVILIQSRGKYALFMGDGGVLAFNSIKEKLPKDIEEKGVKFLKTGHHGAKNVLNKEMAEFLRPELSIVSTGPNTYGHPNKETLKLLENSNTKTFLTKNSGAIKFVQKPNGKNELFIFKDGRRTGNFQKPKTEILKKTIAPVL